MEVVSVCVVEFALDVVVVQYACAVHAVLART